MAVLSPALRGHLAMLTFSALVAGSFSLGTRVANDLPPPALNAARFLIAMAIIGGAAAWWAGFPQRAETRFAWRAPWRYLVLGGLLAVYFVLMFEGLKTAPPVSAAAVFTLTPAMAGVFGWFLLGQVAGPRIIGALAIGGVGALWVIFRGDLAAMLAFDIGRGEVIYFWGCAAHALYTPMVRRLNRGEPPVVFSFGTLLAGSLVLLVWAAPDLVAVDWRAVPMQVWGVIFYLAIFASAATFVLLQFAALRLPASKVMAYTYLIPSWVIGWEAAMGGALPPLVVLGGVLLTVLALALLLEAREGDQAGS